MYEKLEKKSWCAFTTLNEDQINLERAALSAVYEENPPGHESWEYSQRQERSCETGWFWPEST